MTALEISALCRASNAQPNGAWCHIHKVPIHVMQAMPVERQHYGVEPATILAIGEAEGLVVSTLEGALRLDILACADGVFSGFTFAERFQLDVGMTLSSVSSQTLNLET